MNKSKKVGFALMFSAIAIVGGYFLSTQGLCNNQTNVEQKVQENNEQVSTQVYNPENSISQYDDNTTSKGITNDSSYALNVNLENNISNITGTLIYNIVILNFNDLNIMDSTFNLQTYKDEYEKIKYYYYQMSCGKLIMEFNYYSSNVNCNSSKFINYKYSEKNFNTFEKNMYKEAKQNAVLLEQCASSLSANCTVLQYANNCSCEAQVMGWPHVTGYKDFCVVVYACDVAPIVIAHEFGHTLNLSDLYTKNEYSTEDYIPCELMSNQRSFSTPINAYSRESLGWLNTSTTSDSATTAVEEISQNGRYKVYYPFTQNQTIAYKFTSPYNDGNVFYIEARNDSPNGTFDLVINRVNTTLSRSQNLYATCQNNCFQTTIASYGQFYTSRQTITTGKISPDGSKKISSVIYTSNDKILDITIENYVIWSDGITFDFTYNKNTKVTSNVTVFNADGNATIANAEIYLNGNYICKTSTIGTFTYNFSKGDVIEVKYGSLNALYTVPELNNSNKNITILLNKANSIRFNTFLTGTTSSTNCGNYFYSTTSTTVNPNIKITYNNNVLYNNDLNSTLNYYIPNNSIITLSHSSFGTYSYVYKLNENSLYKTSGEIVYGRSDVSGVYFDLYIQPKTTIYTLNITYGNNSDAKYASVKEVKAYNSNTQSWETLTGYNSSNKIATYVELADNYTKIQIKVENYWETNYYEFTLNPYQSTINYSLEQNIVEDGLDWFFNLFQ